MIHDPITPARTAPSRAEPLELLPYPTIDELAPLGRPARGHPMRRPARPGILHDLVLYARRPVVQARLEHAMLVAAGLLVALIASGYLRAALGHRLELGL